MTKPDLYELGDWCRVRDIEISEAQLEQFSLYKKNLLIWNERINLTAITDDTGIWQKHLADSLTLLSLIKGERLLDIGTGAGFPGIPIKIMRPGLDVSLLDSLRKRQLFLQDTITQLGLTKITLLHARAEDLAKDSTYKRQFDICTARAVARLDKLCKYALPFLKKDGLFLAMKGPDAEAEVRAALPLIKKLGGELLEIKKEEIVPGLVHSIVIICYTE